MKLGSILAFLMGVVMACELEQEYLAQIKSDFLPFEGGITEQMWAKTKRLNGCLVQIRHHRIFSKCRIPWLRQGLKEVERELPDMQFFFNPEDEPCILKHNCKDPPIDFGDTECYCDRQFIKPEHLFFYRTTTWYPVYEVLPVLSACTIYQCFRDILVPSGQHLIYGNLYPKQVLSWEQKQFKVCWRGNPNGGYFAGKQQFKYHQRMRLVDLCQNMSECDVKLHKVKDKPKEIKELLESIYPMGQHMSYEQQSRCKIIIDIDGVTYSERFTNLLKLGSAIFKIAVFQDVGTLTMRPWEHFIPVKIDLSDFKDKLQWAKGHDQELKRIAMRGRQRSLQTHQTYFFRLYWKTVLLKYHQLMVKGGAALCKKKTQLPYFLRGK